MKFLWIAIGLLACCAACSPAPKAKTGGMAMNMNMSMDMSMPPSDKPLKLQLAAKKYLQAHVPDPKDKKILFLVDRSMDSEALDAYQAAAASLGIYSTTIILEAKRDIDTPSHLLAAYQQDWTPHWIQEAASTFDHVFLGTYWNYAAFLPQAQAQKWETLPYLTSKQLLSDQVQFPQRVQSAVQSAVETSLQSGQQTGLEISDPEGTHLKAQSYALSGTRLQKLANASGEITVSIYQGLNAPLHFTIQNGEVKEISGGGELGDTFRKIAAKNKLALTEISFGMNPKAALPSDFSNLYWSAWVSAWYSMNERSGTVRYTIAAPGHNGQSWQVANYYPTVKLGQDSLIEKGHLLALDSPAVTAALSQAKDSKADLLKEAWSPYPQRDKGQKAKETTKAADASKQHAS